MPAAARHLTLTQKSRKRHPMVRIALLAAVFALSACETVKGVWRDITRTAEAVDGAFL